jgi:LmbE family N-acetylglucosaminyl deacetylase
MRWIYLSPHFDDAVLSCGGLIWEQSRKGISTEIWTICAGDAPPGPLSVQAHYCHAVWGTGDAVQTIAIRTEEDQNAADLVGAQTTRFSIPDCIYRRDGKGELIYPEDISGSPRLGDKDLDADIAAALASELQPADVLVSPLTLGAHVDHILTRLAAERLGRPLLYYADIPYLFRKPETLAPATDGMKSTLHPVSEKGLTIWQHGIAAYKSQMTMLFEGEEQMRGALRQEWESRSGICLWEYHKS